ncbi:NPCBM/NEW2 domain-containing protein [Amycolatopsis thailandensis]|uniref:NPCBM/NEW2 domain-containing protein n=1 Tax=Amycolatopsis thailandensis TaxID=589330 RepID=UPI0036483C5F
MNLRRPGAPQNAAPPTRFLPQTLGIIADLAAVSVLIVGGGLPIVWATSLGAVLLGVFAVWRRWGNSVDVWLVAGVAVAVAGAGVFGFSLATERSAPVQSPGLAAATRTPSDTSTPSAPPPASTTPALENPLSAPPSSIPPPNGGTWLIDLPKIEGGYGNWRRGEAAVGGQTLRHSMIGTTCSKSDDGHEVFTIDQRFQTFHATLGIADGAPAETVTRFVVKVDGQVKATRDLRPGQVDLLELPVTKGKQLLLQVDNIDSPCSATAVWGDAVLR